MKVLFNDVYITLILLGDPKWGRFSELSPIYQGCLALTFALARLACYIS